MFLGDKKYSLDAIFRMLIGLALFGVGLWLLNYLSDVLIPFAIAFLLAYIINPMVVKVQNKVNHRGAAVFIVLITLSVIITGATIVIIPILAHEVHQASILISRLVHDSEMTQKVVSIIPPELWNTIQEPFKSGDLSTILKNRDYLKGTQEILKRVLPGALGIMAGTAQILMGITGLFIIILYLVFLLKDFKKSKEEWTALLPNRYRIPILSFVHDLDDAMGTYFRAQSHVATLVGILFAISFWVIGLPMGILLGLAIGLLNMVPYLQLIAIIPAVFLAFAGAIESGASPYLSIGLTLLVFAIVQVIQDAIITPRIMGKVTGLSPAMILLSISVWGKLLGLLGLIIAIPASCLLLATYKRLQSSDQTD
ncbi:MAG: AI-2E family transporter [Fibrobacterales bacterium]